MEKDNKFIRSTIPIWERTSISSQLLSKYPQYKPLFASCVSCGKNSLKPVGYKKMTPAFIKENDRTLERKCANCGFLHKPLGIF